MDLQVPGQFTGWNVGVREYSWEQAEEVFKILLDVELSLEDHAYISSLLS